MIPRPVLNRIPGELTKTKADKHTEDLTKLTKVQLIEIKEREEKLLSKKSQLARLPDKGERIKNFYQKILKELSLRDEIENAAKLFSDLNIASTGQTKMNNLEWTGQLNAEEPKEQVLDSDDEETDPLKIIAQSTDLKKKIKYIEPEKSLITENDLKDIEEMKAESLKKDELVIDSELVDLNVTPDLIKEKLLKSKLSGSLSSQCETPSSSNTSLNLEPHSLYLMDKSIDEPSKKEKFLPFKTTKTNVHDPSKEKARKLYGNKWENTAATPPSIQHTAAQMLSLKDSVEIQIDYLEKLKKLQEKQALERLAAKTTKLCDIKIPNEQMIKVNKFFASYRDNDLGGSDESDNEEHKKNEKFDSDEEVFDEDDADKGGCVTFQVYE